MTHPHHHSSCQCSRCIACAGAPLRGAAL